VKEKMPTREELKEMLFYEESSGFLFWRIRANRQSRWNSRYAGKRALYVPTRGYCHGTIEGVRYLAHRIFWKMATGLEAVTIDHIDGDRSNNRIQNLRNVTKAENLKNKGVSLKNKTGHTGVFMKPNDSKWIAYIDSDSKRHYLGRFFTFEEAVIARKQAEIQYGFHENHGKRPQYLC
jgi:hypothetical protein